MEEKKNFVCVSHGKRSHTWNKEIIRNKWKLEQAWPQLPLLAADAALDDLHCSISSRNNAAKGKEDESSRKTNITMRFRNQPFSRMLGLLGGLRKLAVKLHLWSLLSARTAYEYVVVPASCNRNTLCSIREHFRTTWPTKEQNIAEYLQWLFHFDELSLNTLREALSEQQGGVDICSWNKTETEKVKVGKKILPKTVRAGFVICLCFSFPQFLEEVRNMFMILYYVWECGVPTWRDVRSQSTWVSSLRINHLDCHFASFECKRW